MYNYNICTNTIHVQVQYMYKYNTTTRAALEHTIYCKLQGPSTTAGRARPWKVSGSRRRRSGKNEKGGRNKGGNEQIDKSNEAVQKIHRHLIPPCS